MGRRMSHSVKRKKSKIEQFRLVVPKDLISIVGKTEWGCSLRTTDPVVAAVKRAELLAFHKSEILRLRGQLARQSLDQATGLVDTALDRLGKIRGSMDAAIAQQLTLLASHVCDSWAPMPIDRSQSYGDMIAYEPLVEVEPVPSIDTEVEREVFKLRAEIFEGRGIADGVVYRELATILLQRRVFRPIAFAVSYLRSIEPQLNLNDDETYDAIAERYLTRLVNHAFESWPAHIDKVVTPMVVPVSATPVAVSAVPQPPSAPQFDDSTSFTLLDAFEHWKRGKRITGKSKTADEWLKAAVRFHGLIGLSDTRLITSKMVKTFGEQVAELPANPKKDVAVLSHHDQIEVAKRDGLPTLAEPTVGKQVAAIRSLLSTAVHQEWIKINPAAGISIEGARWDGDERDHFSDDDMRRIYSSPLMTDPDACGDTTFWLLFLAPFHGTRPGEHCKLKPREIVEDDGDWVMRIRADKRTRGVGKPAGGSQPRKQKTRSSIRDIPIHWIVIEGGFLDFARLQADRGAEWLFDDLVPDVYGDRYKEQSRIINKALRAVGITDTNKAFYSTRHSMKREGRRRRIATANLNQLAGHAAGNIGDKYGQGAPIDILKDDIDRLEFRSVEWDAVVACAQARVARLQQQYVVAA